MATSPSAPNTPVAEPPPAPASGDDLMSRMVAGAHQTIDRLAESAAPAVERLQEAGDQVGARAGQLQDLGDEWTESLRDTVRQHPLTSVAVALAAGVLLARVMR